jgi:plasmid stabilization system protein ParE
MSRYALTTEAQEDLRGIRQHLIEEAGSRVACYVLTKFVASFRVLASTPSIGHLREDLTTREDLRFWRVFSYLIVYRLGSKPLAVVAVLHGKRDVAGVLRQRELLRIVGSQ